MTALPMCLGPEDGEQTPVCSHPSPTLTLWWPLSIQDPRCLATTAHPRPTLMQKGPLGIFRAMWLLSVHLHKHQWRTYCVPRLVDEFLTS